MPSGVGEARCNYPAASASKWEFLMKGTFLAWLTWQARGGLDNWAGLKEIYWQGDGQVRSRTTLRLAGISKGTEKNHPNLVSMVTDIWRLPA